MKKIFLLGSFFLITPLLILFSSVFLLFSLDKNQLVLAENQKIEVEKEKANYAVSESFLPEDSRVSVLKKYFSQYGSPLEPYAEEIVTSADKYGIDFRLVPAIAMTESTLCKKIPEGSFNCWGFGIYGSKVLHFDDFSQAIESVTKTLALNYVGKGLITPEQMMSKYAPSNDGRWAKTVNFTLAQLQALNN